MVFDPDSFVNCVFASVLPDDTLAKKIKKKPFTMLYFGHMLNVGNCEY